MRSFASLLALATAATVSTLLASGSAGDKIMPATDAPPPLSPEESLQRFQLPEGFWIEPVAAEPLLAEPTGMCFDAKGRLFVCELHGYNRDGYYDILELNKTGVLDKAVRRIPATKEAEARAEKETYGTVKMLGDTKGTGRFDRMTVFADRLPPCYGVVPARDGVIVLCAPDIMFLADRDGDGKAEVREKLFTGFGVGEIWTRISNPRWGVDNWIYAASGATSRGTITGPRLQGAVKLGNTGFRFKPDGSRLEPVSGGTSGYGLAFDDWGDRFLVTNQQHALFVAPLPYHALVRNPYHPAVNPVGNICTYGHPAKLFPASQPDPWRRKRGAQQEWEKFYGASETTAGLFTSACAPMIYQGDAFPAAYQGNHFSCEPAQNLVHRCLLEPRGAGFAVKRAKEGKEFLTSTDAWFRPVNLSVGPDGCMYIVDMYREIIEDYSAIPRYLQQQYVEGLKAGFDKGRVWRVGSGERRPPRMPHFAELTDAALAGELSANNIWRRTTAQRLLIERRANKALPALAELCRSGREPQGRLHALHTLAGLDALTPEMLQAALADEHYGVRTHALQLAESRFDDQPALLAKALALTGDADAKVRLQLAFSLGACQNAKTLAALANLGRREGGDRWMQTAILSAVPDRSVALARALWHGGELTNGASALLGPLAAVVGARNQAGETAELLGLVIQRQHDAEAQLRIMTGLLEGLSRGQPRRAASADELKAFQSLVASSPPEVKALAFRAAGSLGLNDAAPVRAARANALKTALDERAAAAARREALAMLTGAAVADLKPLGQLLNARQPLDVQLAAVRTLAAVGDNAVVPLLLADWQAQSPRVQAAIIDALCGRKDRLGLVLDAVEKKIVEPASVPPPQRTQLLDNPDAGIRARAESSLPIRPSALAARKCWRATRSPCSLSPTRAAARKSSRRPVPSATNCKGRVMPSAPT
jgi:putative membrane-bound dehydrogenase-like protein